MIARFKRPAESTSPIDKVAKQLWTVSIRHWPAGRIIVCGAPSYQCKNLELCNFYTIFDQKKIMFVECEMKIHPISIVIREIPTNSLNKWVFSANKHGKNCRKFIQYSVRMRSIKSTIVCAHVATGKNEDSRRNKIYSKRSYIGLPSLLWGFRPGHGTERVC